MSNEPNEAMLQRAAEVQSGGEERWGKELWGEMIQSVHRIGVPATAIQQIVASQDGVQEFELLGKNSMLHEMAAGTPTDARVKHLEDVYGRIRERERENHRAIHGRSRR